MCVCENHLSLSTDIGRGTLSHEGIPALHETSTPPPEIQHILQVPVGTDGEPDRSKKGDLLHHTQECLHHLIQFTYNNNFMYSCICESLAQCVKFM